MNISRRFFISTTALVMLVSPPAWAGSSCNAGKGISEGGNSKLTSDINRKVANTLRKSGALVGGVATAGYVGYVGVGIVVAGGVITAPAIAVGIGLIAVGVVAGAVVGQAVWKGAQAVSNETVNNMKESIPQHQINDACLTG